jgi:hypothetical protein
LFHFGFRKLRSFANLEVDAVHGVIMDQLGLDPADDLATRSRVAHVLAAWEAAQQQVKRDNETTAEDRASRLPRNSTQLEASVKRRLRRQGGGGFQAVEAQSGSVSYSGSTVAVSLDNDSISVSVQVPSSGEGGYGIQNPSDIRVGRLFPELFPNLDPALGGTNGSAPSPHHDTPSSTEGARLPVPTTRWLPEHQLRSDGSWSGLPTNERPLPKWKSLPMAVRRTADKLQLRGGLGAQDRVAASFVAGQDAANYKLAGVVYHNYGCGFCGSRERPQSERTVWVATSDPWLERPTTYYRWADLQVGVSVAGTGSWQSFATVAEATAFCLGFGLNELAAAPEPGNPTPI